MRVPTFLLILVPAALLLAILACNGEKAEPVAQPKDQDTTQKLVATPLPNPDEILVKAAAEKLVDQFSRRLRSELMDALAKGDAASAIAVCSEKAPALAMEMSGEGWSIRRLSMRQRNPNNYPVSTDAAFYQQLTADSSLTYLATWKSEFQRRTYNYYKPIYMQSMCKSCHGKTEEMDPAVVAQLAKLYPDDRAVGFEDGDLRGIFAVVAQWPDGKEKAEKIMSSSEK